MKFIVLFAIFGGGALSHAGVCTLTGYGDKTAWGVSRWTSYPPEVIVTKDFFECKNKSEAALLDLERRESGNQTSLNMNADYKIGKKGRDRDCLRQSLLKYIEQESVGRPLARFVTRYHNNETASRHRNFTQFIKQRLRS